ncbi:MULTISPECIES: site-2 protease family protein [Acidithiobacillus]|jgi:Zn-dependent protease|uniref:Membrane-associated zinc metalloprotease, putative n=2 Tax=Acidithiobacillus ferrooxidans TaxID=920 RepID=B7JBP4_ACIF2|nr:MULTISPECIES: site-2 protease family protein [Acidithiobacillus]EGQ64144.1 membrane-associated zinc metalloprotease, putative [Acidithiobacillus sp. GGI-221]MCL4525579.1 site-2 protease family protein [Gammaproteobacteria bacterium]ACH83696.1 peptidase M50 [Acidithiobacillus ferrooxidans ATCC 53993]ACK78691.1 membrane-associated zinc metalloprotease, putative [Acidithiobacillus ferrooxidans ATCC 23270]MBN6743935.1 site-2 protease family protein [Acidithiobacillus sp. MC2.2]
MSDAAQFIQTLAIWAIPVLFAITVHEVAHGWVAWKRGDPTAMLMGRLTLNPIKHIDPFGTILLPGILLLLHSPFLFGYAKPVPVNFDGLKDPKRDMVLVAIAGPAANLLMAFFWTLVLWLGGHLPGALAYLDEPMQLMGKAGIMINVILIIFNLIPIPPLDGGRVAVGLLPPSASIALSRIEPYGFIILIVLLFTGVLWSVLGPLFLMMSNFFLTMGGW